VFGRANFADIPQGACQIRDLAEFGKLELRFRLAETLAV
jgi:hypothetical protein